ncbi:MAG: hypothetical protein ABSE06_13405 [Anaerolineaceae bacterium]
MINDPVAAAVFRDLDQPDYRPVGLGRFVVTGGYPPPSSYRKQRIIVPLGFPV